MRNYLLVAIGSAVGGMLRLMLGTWFQLRLGDVVPSAGPRPFPIGTLLVNIGGSFLIGVLLVLVNRPSMPSSVIQYLLVVGVCGGFTTFSTFSADTVALLETGAAGLASLNVAASLACTFAATWAGVALTRSLAGVA